MGLQDSMNDKNRKAMWVSVDYFCTQLCSIRDMLVVDLFSHTHFEWCTFKRKRYWKKSVDENEKLLGNKWSLMALLHDNSTAGCFNSIEFHLSWYEFLFFLFLFSDEQKFCIWIANMQIANWHSFAQSIDCFVFYLLILIRCGFSWNYNKFSSSCRKKRQGLLQFWCDSDMSNRQKKTHWLY